MATTYWQTLKNSLSEGIKANNNQEITGQLLQSALLSMVDALGAGATFAGIATPQTSPGIHQGPVFYFATQEGYYPNFDNHYIPQGLSVIYSSPIGLWSTQTVFVIADSLNGDAPLALISQQTLNQALDSREWIEIESEEKLEASIELGTLDPKRIYYVKET